MIPILVVFVVKSFHAIAQLWWENSSLAGQKKQAYASYKNLIFQVFVALLLNGLRSLRHVVYDVMSDVLTYIDFNTSDLILPKLELRYIFLPTVRALS